MIDHISYVLLLLVILWMAGSSGKGLFYNIVEGAIVLAPVLLIVTLIAMSM